MSPQIVLGLVALCVTVAAQFGAIIWFSSKMATSVSYLTNAVEKLTEVVHALQSATSAMERRVAVIEDRYTRPGGAA